MAEGLRKKAEYATRRPNGFWLEPQTLGFSNERPPFVDRFWMVLDYEFHPIFLSRGENHHRKGRFLFSWWLTSRG